MACDRQDHIRSSRRAKGRSAHRGALSPQIDAESGALGTELIVRLVNLNDVPRGCRTQLRLTEEVGYAWSTWSTPQGVDAARGGLDVEGSRRIGLPLTDRVVRHGQRPPRPVGLLQPDAPDRMDDRPGTKRVSVMSQREIAFPMPLRTVSCQRDS